MSKYDFAGWATRNNVRCSDGRIIRPNAFAAQDGMEVPLVWNHDHSSPENTLGNVVLENRPEGVYAYGFFNDTENGQTAKQLVEHGDVKSLSICANRLNENKNTGDVYGGKINEVSLVLAGANPKAYIEDVVSHGDGESEVIIYMGEPIELSHSDEFEESDDEEEQLISLEEYSAFLNELSHADDDGTLMHEFLSVIGAGNNDDILQHTEDRTVGDVLNDMTDEQKKVVAFLIDAASKTNNSENTEYEGDVEMNHNVFESTVDQGDTLTHAEIDTIFRDAKKGSLKDSVLQHADEYGIEQIDWLFPEARNLNNPPEFIRRDITWVDKLMKAVHKSPFSRIKSQYADLTADAARAKGYMKGKLKKEQVFTLLKRTTTPQTIYKKQKLDRDDIIDITDFDVVAWIKSEMRFMLDEEIARAILVGDGRETSDDDHISEEHIRPIYNDEELYTIQQAVAAGDDDDATAKNFIRCAIKARKKFKGSGEPTLFTTEEMVTNMLLLTDEMGRDLYESKEKLCTKLRVKEIVTVEVMEGAKGKNGGTLLGIIVNPADYNVGADKGGAINMFDDFDIDYNQQKYLIETRCSGALVKPYSAIALELATTSSSSSESGD